ncbi:SPOR domain-containing protein [Evansella clarkii]|uniref:SPOR domain-containing protein n=1 Tax=Evansella clarkii TaxID=79879 RepID=UPI000B451FB2|nr:SPOR domain-containing protein [Evansella clarkii]
MEKKKNVSIRLNGKEQIYTERARTPGLSGQSRDKAGEETAASSEQKNTETEIADLETDQTNVEDKIIDFNKKQKEKQERSLPFWDDGKRDAGPRLPPFQRKKKNSSGVSFNLNFIFHSVFLAIAAAVITGGIFGFIMLNIFTGGDNPSDPAADGGLSVTTGTAAGAVVPAGEDGSRSVPPLNLYVIQGGAFSLKEKAEETASALRGGDFPAVITENTDPLYLFIGIGSSKEDAEKLSVIYNERGTETYIKSYDITGSTGIPEEWAGFFEKGTSWMEKAATITAKDISGEALSNEEVTDMLQAGQAWEEEFQGLSGETDKPYFQEAGEWLKTGEPALRMYSSSVYSSSSAWEVQEALIKTMIAYEKLILAVKNTGENQ